VTTPYLPTAGVPNDPQWNGVYSAQVAVTADPLNVGRVRLIIPQVLGTAQSNWATPMQPGITPAAGTKCLAEFLGGDINKPYYFLGVNASIIEAASGSSAVLNSNAFFTGNLLTGWTASNGTLTALAPNVDTNPPFPNAALLTTSGSGGGYIQESAAPFTAVIGQPYQVQAWVYYPLGGNVNIGSAWTGHATTVTSIAVPAGTWTYISTVVTATATTGFPLVGPATSSTGQLFMAEAVTVTGQIPGQLISASSISQGQVTFTARQIGGITTTIAATAPLGAVAADLWFNSSANYALSQYDGTTWNLYQFGTGAIAAGSITAAQIAAATITAAQIAAGTITATQIAAATITASKLAAGIVVAGIVDATTISGATVIADGASGQLLIYSGTPAHGNLIGSWSGVAGTDGFSNTYPAGLGVNQGTISGTTLSASVFSGSAFTANSSGEFYYSGATPANSFSVIGVPFSSNSSTIPLTTVSIGDALVVEVITGSTTQHANSLASGNVTTWTQLVPPTVVGSESCTVFIGQVTSLGSDTITITYNSGSPSVDSSGIEISAAAGYTSISLDGAAGTVNAVTNTFASLTPAAAGEFYFGYAFNASIAQVGGTHGYFYTTDANGNGMCYNSKCSASAQAPVWGDSPADQINGVMVLLKSTGGATGSHVLTGSNASGTGTDAFSNNYLAGTAAYNNMARTAVSMVGGVTTYYTMTPNPGAAFTAVGSVQAQAGSSGSVLSVAGQLAGLALQGGGGGPGVLTTDANGIPIFTSANGNNFKSGLQCLALGNNDLVNATSFAAVATLNLDAGNYRVRARVMYQTGSTAAGTPTFGFSHGSSAHCNLWTSKAAYFNNAGTGFTAQYQHVAGYPADFNGPTMVAGSAYFYEMDAYVAIGVSGTVILSAATSIATDTFTIVSGSLLEAVPV
jgi:hypothetical protein